MSLILAHRGASADYPENTILAFERALMDVPRAAGFECDIRLSADGVPVVFHDDETTRLTGQPGTIETRSIAAIRALNVAGEGIPTLSELIAHLQHLPATSMTINIELKPTGSAEALIQACEPMIDTLIQDGHRVIISSFDPRVLDAAIARQSPWRLAFLYETLDALRFLDFLDSKAPLDLHPKHSLVDSEHLARYEFSPFDKTRRSFRTWTVDDPVEAKRLRALGVDAIITNTPQDLSTSPQPDDAT